MIHILKYIYITQDLHDMAAEHVSIICTYIYIYIHTHTHTYIHTYIYITQDLHDMAAEHVGMPEHFSGSLPLLMHAHPRSS